MHHQNEIDQELKFIENRIKDEKSQEILKALDLKIIEQEKLKQLEFYEKEQEKENLKKQMEIFKEVIYFKRIFNFNFILFNNFFI